MTVLATVVLLGVLIFVHELGHFWAAKLVDIEVQRFSIGLGPRVWGFTRGETEYVLSLVPLGGYVKMGGMDDEVMENIEGGAVSAEPRRPGPRDFDSKSIPARTFVISAGVIMNMIFAFLAYTAATGVWGVPEVSTTRVGAVVAERLPEGAAALADLPVGSRIVRIGDRSIEDWGDVAETFVAGEAGPTMVESESPDWTGEIRIPEGTDARRALVGAIEYWLDPVIGQVVPGGPAADGGVRDGDRVVSVAGIPVENWWDVVREVSRRPGERVELSLLREGRELTRVVELEGVEEADPVTGETEARGQLGIRSRGAEITTRSVGLVEAARLGWDDTVYWTGMIVGFLRDLVTGNVSPRNLGSIVTIGEASGQAAAQGLPTFLRFMALFSINLAVLNLLPIPILDGGHLLFLGIEAVRGQALSVEQRIRWSQVGLIIVVGIMVWALSNDFLRLLGL